MAPGSQHVASILLVEDEEVALKLLGSILARKFPEAVLYCASNGRTGLEIFRERRPDIVITDINMPEMSGIQMAGHIRVINPLAKIIVLSAGSGAANPEPAAGKGVAIDHYIYKPVDFKVLFAAVEECLAGTARQKPR